MDRAALNGTWMGSAFAQALRPKAGAVAVVLSADANEVFPLGRGVDVATPMEIASVTKGFTGLLLAEALRRGETQLDARVDEVLFGERWSGGDPITLEALATHMSGLPRLSFPAAKGMMGDPYRRIGEAHVLEYLQKNKPVMAAASTFAYSNFGFAVLGLVLQRMSGRPLGALLRERLFVPFGMETTQLQTPTSGTLVRGGFNAQGLRANPWHMDAYAGCGGIVSTAAEMELAVRALVNASGEMEEIVELAVMPRAKAPGGMIGLAWLTREDGPYHWHNGATFGYCSYVGFSRVKRCGVVLLTNQFNPVPLTETGHEMMRMLLLAQ